MKKLLVGGFGLVFAGTFALSFIGGSDEANAKEEVTAATPVHVQTEKHFGRMQTEADIVGRNAESGKPIFSKESYQLDERKVGYSSLENYVNRTYKDWQSNSEYRSVWKSNQDSANFIMANAALHYINYFKKDIAAKGLTECFNELQDAAYTIVNENGGGDKAKIAEATEQFGKKLHEIYLNM